MRILENGVYRDATEKEIKEMQNSSDLPPAKNEITTEERLAAAEAAILELAEVVLNG